MIVEKRSSEGNFQLTLFFLLRPSISRTKVPPAKADRVREVRARVVIVDDLLADTQITYYKEKTVSRSSLMLFRAAIIDLHHVAIAPLAADVAAAAPT